jgi:hypothetical protein
MRFFTLLVTITGIGLLSISCTTAPVATSHWQGPITAGTIDQPVINEASGLAASRRADNIFWINNDSGGEPVLYAIDGKGRYLGSVRFEGATLYDWEDCASFKIDGKSYLLAADVGDNYAQRKDCVLYIIAEPDPATLDPNHELSAAIVGQIRYTYPEGARDCENVAVEPVEGSIYLISKRTVPPVVYRLPLSLEKSPATLVAARVGELHGIPQPTGPSALIESTSGKYRAWPCSLDIASDQRTAVVLTYGEVYLYTRPKGRTWAEAFASEPLQLAAHKLPQAEGVCFTNDNKTVLVATEGSPVPLLKYSLKP